MGARSGYVQPNDQLGGDVHIHNHIAGSVISDRQLQEIIADGLRRGYGGR